MALVELYTLLPQIVPYARNCPEPVIRQQLRVAAREFARETEMWRETLDAVDTVVAQEAYTLAQPTNYDTVFARLLKLTVNDTEQDLELVTLSPDGELTLGFSPATAGHDIVATVAFLPKEVCYRYPGWFMDRWQCAIVNGTLATILGMNGSSWRGNAKPHFDSYRADVNAANSERYMGRINKPLRVQMRRWV